MTISPFNPIFFVLVLISAALTVLVWLLFKDKSEKAKASFLVAFGAFIVVLFFVYKGFLSVDKQFVEISGIDKFNWFAELPLNLCNINMLLVPIGILTRCRPVLGFAFFTGPIGAIMALVFPEPSFEGYSLLIPRIAGFYLTHFLIIVLCLSVATLGFFRPRFKDFPAVTATLFGATLIIHFINMLLRATVCPQANYFFTYGAPMSILQLFWKLIPVPFLYLLPAILILLTYMTFVTLIFFAAEKIAARKNASK